MTTVCACCREAQLEVQILYIHSMTSLDTTNFSECTKTLGLDLEKTKFWLKCFF